MILSIFFTDYWYSYVFVDEIALSVLQHGFSNWDYTSDVFSKQITKKKLDQLSDKLKDEFKSKGFVDRDDLNIDDIRCIFSSYEKMHNDISLNYTFTEITDQIPYPTITIDYNTNNSYRYLDIDGLNSFMNYKTYNIPLDFKLKFKLDYLFLKEFFRNNVESYIGSQNLILFTHSVPNQKRKDYIELVTRSFADNSQVAGMWKISIDDSFSIVPLLSVLLDQNLNLKDFFMQNPLHSDAQLIIAPEVKECEISTDFDNKGKGQFEKRSLEESSLSHIELETDKKIYIKWKSSKSKYKGIVNGSEVGVYIDNRNPYEK